MLCIEKNRQKHIAWCASAYQNKKSPIENICFQWDMAEGVGFEPTCPEGKRFSRSLPKNTVSAQFGAVCAKTIPKNPYLARLLGTVWNRYELKRIDRNRYRPLVF